MSGVRVCWSRPAPCSPIARACRPCTLAVWALLMLVLVSPPVPAVQTLPMASEPLPTDPRALFAGSPADATPHSVDSLTDVAAALMDDGHAHAAVRILAEALSGATSDTAAMGAPLARARAALAAGYVAARRFDAADSVYARLIEALPPDERALYESVYDVAGWDEYTAMQSLGDSARAWAVRRFWLLRDPQPLTAVNERKLEHYRRVWYSLRHFPRVGRGYDDRGALYVRYGPPTTFACDSRSGTRTETWTYVTRTASVAIQLRDRPRQGFVLPVLFDVDHLCHAEDDDARSHISSVSTRSCSDTYVFDERVDPLRASFCVTQFRGPNSTTEVEVCCGVPARDLPLGRASDGSCSVGLLGGIAAWDGSLNRIADASLCARGRLNGGPEAYRDSLISVQNSVTLPGGERAILAAQLVDSASCRAQSVIEEIDVCAFDSINLAISDLVLSERMTREDGPSESPFVRNGWRFDPVPALAFRRGGPVFVYFEAYNLGRTEDTGMTEYEVETLIKENSETHGWGLIRFLRWLFSRRTAGVGVARVIQGLRGSDHVVYRVGTESIAPGDYIIEVALRDLVGGASVKRTRRIRIFE